MHIANVRRSIRIVQFAVGCYFIGGLSVLLLDPEEPIFALYGIAIVGVVVLLNAVASALDPKAGERSPATDK